jgi:hypothetical protein
MATNRGHVIQGEHRLADLRFTAVAGQTSAFVPLLINEVAAWTTNGTLVGNTVGVAGQLVVIGEQPLLEAMLSTNGQRILILYGRPGTNYIIEATTDLANPLGWQSASPSIGMSNLVQVVDAPTNAGPIIFYRVRTGP